MSFAKELKIKFGEHEPGEVYYYLYFRLKN